ncbi:MULTISPECIES: hypothetical protein [Methylomonas]|uniref:Uncharacterized protein n=2 Tax=Methylomonas TaxID=416 RepID=A0A126T640_9GAMM|nr:MULTISPECIES: hypothetical protein [Methylomonas]AMK77538.1 hypothetical protein JT25_013770 [Methylomonas denitrificans]OAI05118.1 hypothetical protein A1342_11935 [Methylomonas methanica]TCV84420.1 hypothetical protein EDE11_10779 [Methylomonas methanica]
MRQIHGLEKLVEQQPGRLNAQKLAELLLTDLRQCRCSIYGTIGDDDRVLLAELDLLADSLEYEMFDQRIDLIVAGPILRNDCVPLIYRLQGPHFAFSGRCSMIARVCGVDLYLQRSYTGVVGDVARQKFAIPLKPLLQML